MSESEPGHGLFAGNSEESLDARTAQLVESIVAVFYKPLIEDLEEMRDRIQALERRVHELERGPEKTEQGG